MKITNLASGSAANSLVCSFGDTHILVDAGLSATLTFQRMLKAGIQPEQLKACLVTHAHGDHINGLTGKKGIASQLRLPVYMSLGAFSQFKFADGWDPKLHLFEPGASFNVGKVRVGTFAVPHDSPGAVGFTITGEGERFALATDLGAITPDIGAALSGADVLFLEANHDGDMLAAGPYPDFLKRRVAGEFGHLSNDAVASFLRNGLPGTSQVILGHVSEGNNTSELVRLVAADAIEGRSQLMLAGKDGGLS